MLNKFIKRKLNFKCGFIEYLNGSNNSDTKKVFFHVSDLIDTSVNELKQGDEVEFTLSHNSRNGKFAATKIKKLSIQPVSNSQVNTSNKQPSGNAADTEQKRPERLNSRLKIANIDDKSGKQLILVRQPLNPDAKIKSFSRIIKERLPGCLDNQKQENQVSPLSIIDLLTAASN